MPSPEYQALERVITADKRYRKFVYMLTVVAYALLIGLGIGLTNNAIEKQRVAVAKAAEAQSDTMKTITREAIRYNTCILLVTIEERRNPKIQQQCFDLADLPGGLHRSDFRPFITEVIKNLERDASAASATLVPGTDGVSYGGSSSKPTPSSSKPQSNNSQPKGNTSGGGNSSGGSNQDEGLLECNADTFLLATLHVECP